MKPSSVPLPYRFQFIRTHSAVALCLRPFGMLVAIALALAIPTVGLAVDAVDPIFYEPTPEPDPNEPIFDLIVPPDPVGIKSTEVEMCYYADGPGRDITGTIAGRPFTNHARIFRITVDDVEQDAFCTDLYNPIGTKQCHSESQIGVTDPKVACVLQYHPPGNITEDDEAATIQAVIWHFSDGFELSPDETIYPDYLEIIADIESKYASQACTPIDNWQLQVVAAEPVHFLEPLDGQNDSGFVPGSHQIAVKLLAGEQPVAGHSIIVSTDVGELEQNGNRGTQLTVLTDSNGGALLTLTHDQPASATISVNTTVDLPVGTRVDPGPRIQKLVTSGSDSFPLTQEEQVEWVAGEKLVIKKFHDKNRDGRFNHNDELIDWTVEVCESDKDDCFDVVLGNDGSEVVSVDGSLRYDVCEEIVADWIATTPICQLNVEPPATVWFGNVLPPALLIQKFHDLNGNGSQDPEEPGIEGWPFQIHRRNGGEWISTYSGNTGVGGRLGYTEIGYYTYRVSEILPTGEAWVPSTPPTQTVVVRDKGLYTATFGNLQLGELTVNKRWLVDGEEVSVPKDLSATLCIRRTGPESFRPPVVPSVDGMPLIQDLEGFFCTAGLTTEVVFETLWPGTYELREISPDGWRLLNQPALIALESGESIGPLDLVNQMTTAAIGDYVWHDVDRNGIQDEGEAGVPGIPVALFQTDSPGQSPLSGTQVATATTNISGRYLFTGLVPSDYYLKFDLPTEYQVSPQSQGVDTQLDSDVDSETGETVATSLAPGEFDMSWDAGIYRLTSPSYTFEKSINNNHADTIEEAEEALVGQELLFEYQVTNTGDSPLTWTSLVDDVFGDLTAECSLPLTVVVGQSVSCRITRPAAAFPNGKVNVGEVRVADAFGPLPPQLDPAWYITTEIPEELAAIGDFVWLDQNQNGLQDAGEVGVSNIVVHLLDNQGERLATTVTGPNGRYLFANLDPGSYALQFELPADHQITAKNQGRNARTDSDAYPETGQTDVTNLQPGEFDMSWDAGIYKPSMPNFVFEKYINGQDADLLGDAVESGVGQELTFDYAVRNSGDVPIIWTELLDDIFGNLSAECGLPINLVVGQTANCRIMRPAGDFPDGRRNVGTAQVSDQFGPLPPRLDPAWYQTVEAEPEKAAIGDFVWLDQNRNGLQDADEAGVPNIVVRLLDAVGLPIATTATDSGGRYIFTQVEPGSYFLLFELPSDHGISAINQGNNRLLDSDVDAPTGATAITTLVEGEYDMSWDAGIYKQTSPSFQFEKYINGEDADLLEDAVLVDVGQQITFLYKVINDGDVALRWETLTDDVFGDLTVVCGLPIQIAVGESGQCQIEREAGDFSQGKSNTGQVILFEDAQPLPPKSDLAWYITPLLQTATAELGDYVWLDEDRDGLQGSNEVGLPGIKVGLRKPDDPSFGSSTQTNDQGFYLFDALEPGNYVVEFSIPTGYTLTQRLQGPNRADDSDPYAVDPTLAHTDPISLALDESNLSIDAGLLAIPPELSVVKVPFTDTVQPGDLVTYTIHYTNSAVVDAVEVEIIEVVPNGTSIVLEQSSPGWACADDPNDRTCIYPVGTLPGRSLNVGPIYFVVRVDNPLSPTIREIVNFISIVGRSGPDVSVPGQEVPGVLISIPEPTNVPAEQEPDDPVPNERPTNPTKDWGLYLPLIE